MTFAHMLVPLDGSPLSAAVLPIATLLARTDSARVTLLGVVADEGSAELGRTLTTAAAPLRAAGLDVATTIRSGESVEQIVRVAGECSVDLILMATHGRTGLTRSVLGSVADGVMHGCRSPLLLLHPNDHPVTRLRTILVPVDGTPGGAVALVTAAPLARASRAKLVLARATTPLPLWLYDTTLGLNTGPLINPMWDEDARFAAETYAEGLAARLRSAGWIAEGRGVSGEPGAALVHLADELDADLIVMSTAALTGPIRSVLGSVAGDVVRQSRRPVLLVRRTHGSFTEVASDSHPVWSPGARD
jgi:nucleotide-binding universal stress UspA family protein